MEDLTKVATALGNMYEERKIKEAMSLYGSYSKDDQIKIARCYKFLEEAEASTKVAAEEGDLPEDQVLQMKSNADRLKVAIELAHLNEVMQDESYQARTKEASACGALMSQLLVDHVNKKTAELTPEMKAMKHKMQKAEDKDDDGKKLEDTAGEHDNLPDDKKELEDWKEKKKKKNDKGD